MTPVLRQGLPTLFPRGIARVAPAAAVAALMAGAPAQAVELIYGTHIPSSHITADAAVVPFFKGVEAATGGEVVIQPQWAGAVAKESGIPGAIEGGLIDMGFMADVYAAADLPNSVMFTSIVMGGTDNRVMTGVASEARLIGCESCDEELAEFDAFLLSASSLPPQYLMCREPLASMDDLKGRKVRATGPLARVMAKWGATPVALPTSDAYESLERGQVDCTTGIETFMKDYSWWDSAKYVLDLPLGTYHGALTVMSKSKFDSLSDAGKEAVLGLQAKLTADTAFAYYNETKTVRDEAMSEHGVTYVTPGQDFLDAKASFAEGEVAEAVANGDKRGAADAAGKAARLAELTEKWTAIVAETGEDQAAFEAALDREIYSGLDR
ncbi:TRAP-type C4-dicarboxylate transport system, substrate-binding protein [Albimonas donghaensis]|uniref:TRAP-type C4-dicarboxylate transport system, substrate-binding protein n=1 Tax=Albimonas donghaensis TaxID=356660 RepID=A0A1H3AW38_9RHOB|nr:TRAP transporter substrate-binding protein DctP [Albimonas donghaensis]SDX33628.1 TRAP-type C4-dicarboxylate transport system, substrate-binding protein [Albimonas donghaensis]